VLPLSIYITLSFPGEHPVAAYVFFLVFPSFLSGATAESSRQDGRQRNNLPNQLFFHDFFSTDE
jgi:hypothetical protein